MATAPVPRGNSGGPLLDGAGNLLGVVSLKVSRFASNGGSDDAPLTIDFVVKNAKLAQFLYANRAAYKTGRRARRRSLRTSPIRRGR